MWLAVVVGAALVSPVVLLAVTTAGGARARGSCAGTAVVAGLLFPLTWVVWYVVDDLPGRPASR